MAIPKYAIVEHERRFLLDPVRLPPLAAGDGVLIEDLYVETSRLRLRRMTAAGTEPVYKLCKKYQREAALPGPIVNIYLDAAEYQLLAVLPGRWVRKRRHRLAESGSPYGVDLFEGALAGLAIAEVETTDAESLRAIAAPEWAVREITADPFYAGGNLAGLGPGMLSERLRQELGDVQGADG